MTYFVSTDETGRIGATTQFEEYAEGMSEFEFPEDFDFGIQHEYRIVEGELIHDPLPDPVDQQITELKSKLAETDYVVIKIYEAVVAESEIPDEDASRYAEIITQRQQWRQQINDLEASVEGGDE